ncbi:hypothetical protein LINPERHAP1_LOCUS14690 [Linum perenne]
MFIARVCSTDLSRLVLKTLFEILIMGLTSHYHHSKIRASERSTYLVSPDIEFNYQCFL